jgi:monofunctional biosynthetic peptidoglycan transglycosylase
MTKVFVIVNENFRQLRRGSKPGPPDTVVRVPRTVPAPWPSATRTARRSPARGGAGPRRFLLRLAGLLLLLAAAFWMFCCAGLFLLKWINPVTSGVQIQRRVEALAGHRPYRKHSQFLPLRLIAPNLQHAVIAAEDGRFYQHHGIDWKAVDSVVVQSIDEGEVTRGASTTWRNPLRKALEFSLAPVADRLLGKQRTLELYLNVIEWGPGIYGAEAASQFYYKTPAARLTRDQAARLAAILPAPLRRRPARMSNYAGIIETRMRQMNW